jgi:hypothetical protein
MVLSYDEFIKENKEDNLDYLLYYAFDWDDNILYMPTVIHMERKDGDKWMPEDASTSKYAEIRTDTKNWRYLDNDSEKAFSDFRDTGPKGPNIFLEDTKKAINEKKFGPSWNDFIECLTQGALFAIITARGHESETIRKAIEWIIDNILTEDELYTMYNNLIKFSYLFNSDNIAEDRILKGTPSRNKLIKEYLDNCDYVGVSSPKRGGNASNPEKAKEDALLEFHDKINNFAIKRGTKAIIGFSDDDIKNAKHIEDLYKNLNKEDFSNIVKYVVKTTKDPNNITKVTKNITESSYQSPGLESSILKFTQFGNMTDHLYPPGPDQRQDDYANLHKRSVKYLTKISKDTLKKKKKRKKN